MVYLAWLGHWIFSDERIDNDNSHKYTSELFALGKYRELQLFVCGR
jgi:hypothetical protein